MLGNYGYVMTLANSIIGVGILAMPFCFQKCGIILSIALLILNNWITGKCCHYLIKSSFLTRKKSFESLGFHAFGPSGKLLVELSIIGNLLGTCVTYFVVVGDLGPQIVTRMFSLEHGGIHHLRAMLMVGITLFCILPLGMLRNVNSLSTVCTASIGFYVCLVIKIVLESRMHIMTYDWTDKVTYWQPSGILQCVPIFSMALSCQMQIFEVFTSISNQSLEKLNGIVHSATWICTIVYIAVGFFGYVAFCSEIFSGNILLNLSNSFGSDAIQIGFILSVAFSFPLVIFPCRASLYSLLYKKGQSDMSGFIPETKFKLITLFIVLFSLSVALIIPSVELIIGLVGSTIGVIICILFPAACFRQVDNKDSIERKWAQIILIGGCCLMILGTYANLHAIDTKHSYVVKMSSLKELHNKKHVEAFINNDLQSSQSLMYEMIEDIKRQSKTKNIPNKKAELEQAELIPTLPPPLPIDENHESQQLPPQKIEKQKNRKINLKLDISTPVVFENERDSLIRSKYDHNFSVYKESALKNIVELPSQSEKNNEKPKEYSKYVKKTNNEDLKQTQNQLKQTKDLLKKQVEELKTVLEKHNQETQQLLDEKIVAVVKKFKQIEHTVAKQKQEEKINKNKLLNIDEINEMINQSLNDLNMNKSALTPSQIQQHHKGTIKQNVTNENQKQLLPLPLALLRNTSSLQQILQKNLDEKLLSQKRNVTIFQNSSQKLVTNINQSEKHMKTVKKNKISLEIANNILHPAKNSESFKKVSLNLIGNNIKVDQKLIPDQSFTNNENFHKKNDSNKLNLIDSIHGDIL